MPCDRFQTDRMARPSEDDIIARFFVPLAGKAGLRLADDAACLAPPAGQELVLTTDTITAGVHFFADDPAAAIAAKALRVNLSDLAAKAAQPQGFLLNLALPADWTLDWLEGFAAGLGENAFAFACPLLGGDTVKILGPLTISITAIGAVPAGRMVPRPGARPGDLLYVTGTIGDAALGLQVRRPAETAAAQAWIERLSQPAREALAARYLYPQPRLALREALRAHARAAMDISDGFAGDLAKMLRLEDATTDIDFADIPLSSAAREALAIEPALASVILSGGDDYEILAAVPPADAGSFESKAAAEGLVVTRIGAVAAGRGSPVIRNSSGAPIVLAGPSFQHF
jgi:thiamine-monophosphate kinase